MSDDNSENQFITTVSNLAEHFAKDRSFVSEIGLDEFPPDMVAPALEKIFNFILGMYKSAKSIFVCDKTLTLDEKFIRLLYTRFMLMPWWTDKPSDALDYSKDAYENIKWHANRSQRKWDDMSLYAKFFEVCAYVLFEENIAVMRMIDEPKWDTGLDCQFVTHPVLSVACEGVFSHVNWELDGVEAKASNISYFKGIQKWKSKNTADDWLIKGELAFIYTTHKRMIRERRKAEKNFSPEGAKFWQTSLEEDFWINFIQITFDIVWDNKSKIEVNLSELLRLYLRIYRADINPEITAEEYPQFLKLMKERFYKASLIYESQVDVARLQSHPVWRLGQLALNKDATVVKQIAIGMAMIEVINAWHKTIPFKLVKDI